MFDLTKFGTQSGGINPALFTQGAQGQGGVTDFSSLLNFGNNSGQAQIAQPNAQMTLGAPKIDNTPGMTGLDMANLGMNGANALLSGYLGFKQFGLAKDQLNFQKQSFNQNFEARRAETNRNLEDRQRARVAADSGAESVESYLKKHGV